MRVVAGLVAIHVCACLIVSNALVGRHLKATNYSFNDFGGLLNYNHWPQETKLLLENEVYDAWKVFHFDDGPDRAANLHNALEKLHKKGVDREVHWGNASTGSGDSETVALQFRDHDSVANFFATNAIVDAAEKLALNKTHNVRVVCTILGTCYKCVGPLDLNNSTMHDERLLRQLQCEYKVPWTDACVRCHCVAPQ